MSDLMKSKIKNLNKKKRFGYISKLDDESGKDYFFLERDLVNIDFDSLHEEMEVYFSPLVRKDTKYAKEIKLDVFSTPSVQSNEKEDSNYLFPNGKINNSELVIGIVSPVGAESNLVIESLKNKLKLFGYETEIIKISSILPPFNESNKASEYARIRHYMKQGDRFRNKTENNSILAIGAVEKINKLRDQDIEKRAFIVDSLKHPDEVELLRKIYGNGFYLFGIHADKDRRMDFLIQEKGCTPESASELIKIDENENISYGQKTRDTYHLSDFFLNLGCNNDYMKSTLQRFLELIFSNPHLNPTFDEFAMFMAFNSSVRSGDLSRQVGAVISKNKQIIATGVNDVPSFGGGLYWAEQNPQTGKVEDFSEGKDYKRGIDSNKNTQNEIIQEILRDSETHLSLGSEQKEKLEEILKSSKISDLTEFGRVVHAEMEAILACGREGIPTVDSVLYCTTFPCHNCAKHIIASGIKRVIYVEPYPKSKALEFHSESIELKSSFDINDKICSNKVIFEPFIGVGPRRFLDLFSMNLGVGFKLKRKEKNGQISLWRDNNKAIRTPLLNQSYVDLEKEAISIWSNLKNDISD